MNIVLVVFDTLRRDAVGCYGQAPPWDLGPIATPNLDAFARESVRFERAYPESLPTLPPAGRSTPASAPTRSTAATSS